MHDRAPVHLRIHSGSATAGAIAGDSRRPSRTSRTVLREQPRARAISRRLRPSRSRRSISSNRSTVTLLLPISPFPCVVAHGHGNGPECRLRRLRRGSPSRKSVVPNPGNRVGPNSGNQVVPNRGNRVVPIRGNPAVWSRRHGRDRWNAAVRSPLGRDAPPPLRFLSLRLSSVHPRARGSGWARSARAVRSARQTRLRGLGLSRTEPCSPSY
jgi:hypothetical protein